MANVLFCALDVSERHRLMARLEIKANVLRRGIVVHVTVIDGG